MHIKVLVFLLGVGYCAAAWTGTKNIRVSEDGSIIEITTPEGKKISIVKSRPTLDRGKAIDISVIRPDMPPRTIRIHDDSETYGNSYDELYGARIKRGSRSSDKSQSDKITELFSEYSGVNDEKSYQKFMKKLEKYVEKGEIDPQILNVLRELDTGNYDELSRGDILGSGMQSRQRLETSQGFLDRFLYGQQGQNLLPRDELLREKIIEAEIADALREEQQAKLKRMLLEEQAKSVLGKDSQVGRVPITRTPYSEWSLLGARDYQPGGVDPFAKWQLLQQIENSEGRSRPLGVREGQLPWNRIYDQRPLDWAAAGQRIPDQMRLEELLREQQREQLIRQQMYGERNPFATNVLANRKINDPAMWQPKWNLPVSNIDGPQRPLQNTAYNTWSRPPMTNWQYTMPLGSYNYQRQMPLPQSRVW